MDTFENKSIDTIIAELKIVISKLNELETPKTNFALEWTGLIGAIQDTVRDKRINRLFNTIIIDDVNYLNVGGYIIRCANTIGHICKDNNSFNVEDLCQKCIEAQNLITICYKSWEAVFPQLMSYGIEDDEKVGKNITMGISTRYYLYQAFNDFILPEKLREENNINIRFIKRTIEQRGIPKESSGCLGVIFALLIPTALLSFFIII